MSIQIIGMINAHYTSETHPQQGPTINKAHIRAAAQAHEQAGFDRILVPQHGTSADASQIIAYAASVTHRVNFLLAHRPGFIQPTFAARQLSTLNQLADGRLAIHIISGGDDQDQQRDGDFLDHDERYARTDEYLGIVRQSWNSSTPFDHKGDYYHVKGAWSEIQRPDQPAIPVYFGGASKAALEVAGKHADVYALWGESLEQTKELIQKVKAEAAKHGREIAFSVSFRPILAETEEAAWARAEQILQTTRELRAEQGLGQGGPKQSEGARRLLATAEKGDKVDKVLWTAIAKETGGRSNSTALVGTPEQVANALLDYYDLGVTTFLIRGFDPVEDAVDYGKELIPRIRQLVAERDKETALSA